MGRAWFSATELAALGLPGLSKAKNKINERATNERWALQSAHDGSPLCRPRQGKGGGFEYHVSLLPPAARMELVRRGVAAPDETAPASNVTKLPVESMASHWAWYEQQSNVVKAEAEARAAAIHAIDRLSGEGLSRSAAVATVAAQIGKSAATVWNWLALVADASPHDRLPRLAPGRRGGGVEAEIPAHLWRVYTGNYLRPEKPTHSASFDLVRRMADAEGISIPHAKTFIRKFERETDPAAIVSTRQGRDAVARMIPPQKRTVLHMQAMEMVNIDGHRWDVFVRWPDGTIARPLMVAIQDIFSRKVLSWRIDVNETAFITRLVFADLFRDWGIPKSALLDNGRAFASKWITGQSKTRYRFKIREDDPIGLLPALGIENRWATPYHGQAKPIERAFKDMCNHIAKAPDFAGAYVGNNPMAKPENYGNAAVPLEVFEKVIAREIAAHNARPSRRTEAASNESFDAVFARSMKTATVGIASEAQMRLALLAGELRRAHREDGSVVLYGNRYWAEGMSRHAGQPLVVRFDPENLHTEVYAYTPDGAFVGAMQVWEAVGFDNADAAQKRAKMVGDHRRAVKKSVELANILDAADIAAAIPDAVDPNIGRPSVIRPVRVRGGAAPALVETPASEAIDFNERFRRASAGLRLVE